MPPLVTVGGAFLTGLLQGGLKRGRRGSASCALNPLVIPMKNDPTFKFVAVILVVGVFLAMISAAHSVATATPLPVENHATSEGAE